MSTPIQTHAAAGHVFIKCDPATARDLAEAFATAYATCSDLETERPRWMDDVVALHTAAMRADLQNGDGPEVVRVPLLAVVAGDPQTTVTGTRGEAGPGTAEADRRAGAPRPRPCSPAALHLIDGGVA